MADPDLRPHVHVRGFPSVNYGGIGSVFTHELMHGFSEVGMEFDCHGKEVNWWSKESERNYRRLLECYNETVENASKGR